MPYSTTNPSDRLLEFLCDSRFHRVFKFTSDSTDYRVSYSDYGSRSSSNVVLFFGGLLGGRLSYTPLDTLARRYNIRIIHADRPGIGATTPVCIEDRIPAYFEVLPKLLAHLGIQHVSLAAHSFGTIYAINALLLYPQLLHPERPLKSSESAQGAADVYAAASGGDVQAPNEINVYDLDLDDPVVVKDLRTLLPTFLFAETIDGAGQDAQLCLRKLRSVPWSTPTQPWADIDDAVHKLQNTIAIETSSGRRWMIDAFHAETDVMVGEKGQIWFDECWQNALTDAGEEDRIMYRSQVVQGSDHDLILDPVFGASGKWMERVAEVCGARSSAIVVEGTE
ncbi:hypothetical protein E8E11_002940 [Didymella keratinophila]|nr:hypothetical protein E8E11_002940 [Didymella keratinophila]